MKIKKWVKRLAVLLIIIILFNTANIARLFFPVKYMDYIKNAANTYQIDPYLIMSMIKSESNFNHKAVSNQSAAGLMQIMEPTAQWLAERMKIEDFDYADITDPQLNIQMGCFYMAYLLDRYSGNVKTALAAYNAGEGTVNLWLADSNCSKDGKNLFYIPYPETRYYVNRVTQNIKIYRLLYRVRPAVLI